MLGDREMDYYEKNPNMVISILDYYINQCENLPRELVIYLDNYGA